jgi:hypothetical protein
MRYVILVLVLLFLLNGCMEKIPENIELSPEECINQGGRTVNIVGRETCEENEENIGKVVGFISPNICCL